MRNSYILRSWNGRIVLLPQILDQLNILRSCVLHGIPDMTDERQPGVILTTIPVNSWRSSYRLVIYTDSKVGSLARVTQVLSAYDINLVSVSAAATSTSADLCLTAIVEIPPALRPSGAQCSDGDLLDIARQWSDKLASEGCLTKSALFTGEGELQKVRLLKLRVLSKLALMNEDDGRRQLRVRVEDWAIDLNGDAGGGDSVADLFSRHNDFEMTRKSLILVTPDTEERYVRLSPLQDRMYREIAFKARITAADGNFTGYYEQALKVLASKKINILGSKTVVTSGSPDAGPPPCGRDEAAPNAELDKDPLSLRSEEALFSFTVDVKGSAVRFGDKEAALGRELERDVSDAMTHHALARGGAALVLSEFRVRPLMMVPPLVFIASNVKPVLSLEHRRYAVRLIRELKARGLQPVNVEVSIGASLRHEVEELLDLCPLLISLYLPEDANRLLTPQGSCLFAPSDYTMYEEAYMCARKNRHVLRLRHAEVFRPRFIGDGHEFAFDAAGFEGKLEDLCKAIDLILADSEYHSACDECESLKGHGSRNWIERDLETWLDVQGEIA